MCMADFGLYIEFQTSSLRKARKQHRCDECNRDIGAGETYHIYTSKCDGQVSSNKTCVHCQVAQRWLLKNCHGFIFTEVRNDLEEHRDFSLAKLAIGMRRKWKAFRSDALMSIPAYPRDYSPDQAPH